MRRRDGDARSPVILLIEDDPGDQELARRALTEDVLDTDLHIASGGGEAMDYLLRRGPYADARQSPRPDLILLDLNMPGLDGRQVLAQIRSHPDLRRIPVIVLTTSRDQEDVVRSYDLGCNSYISKPADVDTFVACVRELGSYWFELVTLPAE